MLSQLKIVIRTNYSNPPTHGAQVVATVLADPALRRQWEDELAGMRQRIRHMRIELVRRLAEAGASRDFSFITAQQGMFSYSGLGKAQMQRLRTEFGVYGVDSGGSAWPPSTTAISITWRDRSPGCSEAEPTGVPIPSWPAGHKELA